MSKFIFSILIILNARGSVGQELPILQGYTTENTTQISVLLPLVSDVDIYALTESGEMLRPSNRATIFQSEPGDRELGEMVHLSFESLKLGETYQFIVKDNGAEIIRDQRAFQALDINKSEGRICVASCMFDKLHNPWAWDQLRGQRADIAFFIGDSVYMDKPSLFSTRIPDERQMRERHIVTRRRLKYFRQKRLTPTVAIFDDHDYGFNNATGKFKLKEYAAKIFRSFFPQRIISESLIKGPGTSFKINLFGSSYFFMDGRTFKYENAESHNAFGREQEQWLQENIDRSKSFLISGNQLFGGYLKKESYEYDFKYDFEKRFLPFLKSLPTQFSFLSGDVHFSEVMEIESKYLGYKTVEITSSPIHSATIPGLPHIYNFLRGPNPRRLHAAGSHNFIVLDVNSRAEHTDIQWKSVSWRGVENFRGEMNFRHDKNPVPQKVHQIQCKKIF